MIKKSSQIKNKRLPKNKKERNFRFDDCLLDLDDVADLLCLSMTVVYASWKHWVDCGLNPIRIPLVHNKAKNEFRKSHVRFWKSEVIEFFKNDKFRMMIN